MASPIVYRSSFDFKLLSLEYPLVESPEEIIGVGKDDLRQGSSYVFSKGKRRPRHGLMVSVWLWRGTSSLRLNRSQI